MKIKQIIEGDSYEAIKKSPDNAGHDYDNYNDSLDINKYFKNTVKILKMQNPYFNKRVYHFNINDTPRTVIITDIEKILNLIYEIKDEKKQRKELEGYLRFIFNE